MARWAGVRAKYITATMTINQINPDRNGFGTIRNTSLKLIDYLLKGHT
jgi:hypothetical protein